MKTNIPNKSLNVSNIPLNTLYRFDINKYVWTTKLNETRGGTHIQDRLFKCTEVYEITKEGYMKLIASGRLVPVKNIANYDEEFGINDYDTNETKEFHVPMYLQELDLKDLYELRDAIAINYKKNK